MALGTAFSGSQGRCDLTAEERGRIVALVAGALKLDFLEGPAVGIGVTVLAAVGCQPFVLNRQLAGLRTVAFLAQDFLM